VNKRVERFDSSVSSTADERKLGRPLRGLSAPNDHGYSVTVDLAADDTYVGRRIFTRGAKVWTKGERSNIYADQVSEVAYYASYFRSHDENEWVQKRPRRPPSAR
jgi:hypothetical protein